jgi:hypothetical protein
MQELFPARNISSTDAAVWMRVAQVPTLELCITVLQHVPGDEIKVRVRLMQEAYQLAYTDVEVPKRNGVVRTAIFRNRLRAAAAKLLVTASARLRRNAEYVDNLCNEMAKGVADERD